MTSETEMTSRTDVDRSRDLSQPLDRLGPDESLKYHSDYLRGTIEHGLLDRITGGVAFEDNKLMKFHGIYQQDDRDIREERRRQKLLAIADRQLELAREYLWAAQSLEYDAGDVGVGEGSFAAHLTVARLLDELRRLRAGR